ncbi:MAG: xanthine dehydrogenase family protein molybdopterin-binding subunit [Spirochaetota bacterium]
MQRRISSAVIRVDARDKAGGYTRYLADMEFEGMLHAKLYRSVKARARIKALHIPPLPSGYYIVDRKDVPGVNRVAMIKMDWPAFAEEEVRYVGQIILMIVGPDRNEISRIHSQIKVDYEEQEAAFTIDEAAALKGGPIHGKDNLFADYHLQKGNPDEAFKRAARIIEDECESGYQEHIYLEPQSLLGTWVDNRIVIHGSMQCPYYVKHAVVATLGWPEEKVRVVQSPTGGGFGGKEDYPEIIGAPLAVAVNKIKKPIRLILDRVEDISFTSKRHPARIRFRTGLDENNTIIAMDIDTKLNGGAYESYSCIVLQRAVFTSTGVYDIPNVRVRGRAYATNTVPSGAFRGFGAPQAIFGIETHMRHIARDLKEDPVELKQKYFLKKGSVTVTNGRIHDEVMLNTMTARILTMSDYRRKYAEYARIPGKGIGISFFNHGCGFTGDGEQRIIKARVKLKKRLDQKVEILVSNSEIGQGVQTGYIKIIANILGIPLAEVIFDNPDTDSVPDSGPTAASRSIMVVGYLLQEAAEELKKRWEEETELQVEKNYTMPAGLKWNQATMQGDAYPTYGWGINVVEVEVDPLTYETETRGIWAIYDVGAAIDERVIEGQINGGLNQGLGYASLEKMVLDKEGLFQQRTMTDYMIPTSLDFPAVKSELVDNPYPFGPFGAKGAGELVFNGAAPAFCAAVEQAISQPVSKIPLTPEAIMEVCTG